MKKNKDKIIFLVIVICFGIFLGYKVYEEDSKLITANTPDNLLRLLQVTSSTGNFEGCEKYFVDGNGSNREKLNIMKDMFSKGFHTDSYISRMITRSDGKRWIINMTPKQIDGQYRVVNVIPVPEDEY